MIGSKPRAWTTTFAGLLATALAATPALPSPDVVVAPQVQAPRNLRTERVLDPAALDGLGVPRPTRLAFDADGALYILDTESRRVAKLDPRGGPAGTLGGYGQDESSFSLPSDIAIDARQSLLVLDRGRNELVAFDRFGQYLGGRPMGGSVAAEILDPRTRLRVDPFGSLWLLAPSERDLVPLDERLERARSTPFLAPRDSVVAPVAAAFLPLGGVCVHDAGGEVLRFFTASGTLQRSVLPGDSTTAAAPTDVAVDVSGYVYVADAAGQRVLVYSPEGTLLLDRALGGEGSRWRPVAIAVGPNDRMAVADPVRGEIQIFSIERGAAP